MTNIATLEDASTGSRAQVLTSFGFNCFSFEPIVDGRRRELLWAAPNFTQGTEWPSRSGIPLLFPFAGRLRGEEFRFAGQSYSLAAGDGQGNAIHGFVHKRPWRVLEQTETMVRGEFHAARDEPVLLEQWPADFRIRVCYALEGNCLRSLVEIDNPSERPLPFGFGTHPYFRVPLVEGGSADACVVSVPVERYWMLDKLLPTGETRPVDPTRQLTGGRRFGEMQLDDIFDLSPLRGAGGESVTTTLAEAMHWATIFDPAGPQQLTIRFDSAFAHCVVFNPPHREAVCIEPYLCGPDIFLLAERGLGQGPKILPPGEAISLRIEIELG